jgi:phosphoglycolate phosphatase/pyrophosphatase PpaX
MLFVVSHSHTDNISRDYAAHFGVQPDGIYGWERPPHERKPNPFPLQDIMTKCGFRPEDILVVDDMQLACQMADPLGVQVAFAGWDDMGVPEQRKDMKARCAYSFYSTEDLEKFLFEGGSV